MDYSAQEVREILEEQGDFYQLQLEGDIYALLGNTSDIPSAGTDLTPDADIVKIAFYQNPGSLQRRMLFDLEDSVGFIDDAVPFELSADQVSALKKTAVDTNISSWQHKYKRDDEKETTGFYAWKMVFLHKRMKLFHPPSADGTVFLRQPAVRDTMKYIVYFND